MIIYQMSSILYYSNYCERSKEIVGKICKSTIKDNIHYLCIDSREKDNGGNTYLVLEKGQRVILPPSITKVPALLLLNEGHRILFGADIIQHLNPREMANNNNHNNNKQVVNAQEDPSPFGFGEESNFGVSSDSFSFWDQSSDDLLAEGGGGVRQMYNYTGLEQGNTIETPPDTYTPDKISDSSLEKMQNERNKDVNPGR